MPDLLYLIRKWRKQVILVVLISLIIATTVVFLLPPQYLASSTALPTNPVSTDKSTVFNENIKDFYNSLGQPGDLDKIVGTGQLDTLYLAMTDQYDLVAHYKIRAGIPNARLKAAAALKKDTKIAKSEYGELRVQVWSRDKNLAPTLANAMMEKLADIHQGLLNRSNRTVLESLKNGIREIEQSIDSTRNYLRQSDTKIISSEIESYTNTIAVLQEQGKLYHKLATEYQLMIDTKPVPFVIIEKARTSDRPDKPKKLLILIATSVLSFLFAAWLALILEKRKSQQL